MEKAGRRAGWGRRGCSGTVERLRTRVRMPCGDLKSGYDCHSGLTVEVSWRGDSLAQSIEWDGLVRKQDVEWRL
ncbi:hypothetical protein Tco_0898927 [Tanacetum coccineum]